MRIYLIEICFRYYGRNYCENLEKEAVCALGGGTMIMVDPFKKATLFPIFSAARKQCHLNNKSCG